MNEVLQHARTGATVVRIVTRMNVGGPALHVTNLSAGLADRFPTVLVTGDVGPGEADLRRSAARRGLDVHFLPQLGRAPRPWDDFIALVRLVRLLRRMRPAIVHTHTAKAGTLGRLAAVLAGVPIRIHTFHGHVFEGYFGRIATRVILVVERLLARATTMIVAISPSQAHDLATRYRICPRERIRVIPLGFDFRRFLQADATRLRGELRHELGVGRDTPVVAIVGRLVPIKNHDLFLRAAALVRARGVPAAFLVVGGDEAEQDRLRGLAEGLGIGPDVRFLGWRSDLERIYAGADVIALTSRNEGTPVALIEALAMGRAVVATDVGGVADVLEEGRLGVLVSPGDEEAFARELERVLRDPELRRDLGERGRQSIPVRFGLERLIEDTGRLYDELLSAEALHSWRRRKVRAAYHQQA